MSPTEVGGSVGILARDSVSLFFSLPLSISLFLSPSFFVLLLLASLVVGPPRQGRRLFDLFAPGGGWVGGGEQPRREPRRAAFADFYPLT